jgi:hypothetical protein
MRLPPSPHGVMMPDEGLVALRDKDAILFGSAGDPHIPDHITLWGLRLKSARASISPRWPISSRSKIFGSGSARSSVIRRMHPDAVHIMKKGIER